MSVCISVCGQDKDDDLRSSIYQDGDSLTSCEINFKNLFANWGPDYADNYTDIEFLSYDYVETLIDSARVRHYADLIITPKMFNIQISGSRDNQHTQQEIHLIQDYLMLSSQNVKIIMDQCKQKFENIINLGDKVFCIKLIMNGKLHDIHEVCSPQTNKVVVGLFGGVKRKMLMPINKTALKMVRTNILLSKIS
jgi:hypothetical protein